MNPGPAFRYIRERRGVAQGDFAKVVGVTQTHLSLFENGKKPTSMDFVQDAAKAHGLPLYYFFLKALDLEKLPADKREYYAKFRPAVLAMLEGFFLS